MPSFWSNEQVRPVGDECSEENFLEKKVENSQNSCPLSRADFDGLLGAAEFNVELADLRIA
jgi:hypothetical protein